MRMKIMKEVICSFLTLKSILFQEKMGKTRPKKLRKVKESKKKFYHLLGRKEQTYMKEKSTH